MTPENHHWIQTYSGGKFSYPDGGDRYVAMIDIARSLSRIPRFLGHTSSYLSVAEHCVVMSQHFETEGGSPRIQLLALLHDAHEAYIGDLPAPLKRFLQEQYAIDLSSWKNHLQRAILSALDIEPPTPEESDAIDKADLLCLAAERRLTMPSNHKWLIDGVEVPDSIMGGYGFWGQEEAMVYFEKTADALGRQLGFDKRV